jgi:DNA polymerase III epsilon subunit-like protein
MDLRAKNAEICVLDYESTGSMRGFPVEPWQIGMVTLSRGYIDPESLFDSLLRIDPNRPFNPHAPGRHALLRDEMAAAPTVAELRPRLESRLALPLCAHNVATEKKFLRSMAPMHRFGPWIDTLRLARRAWPGLPSYALENCIDALGLKPMVGQLCPEREAHDALYDAVASAAILQHLLEDPGWNSATIADLVSLS